MTTASTTSPVTIRADAIDLPVRSGTADCVVTSPPYWALRTYGDDPQEIGKHQSMDDYIDTIVHVCGEVRRILKDDGLFWLNLGDTASGSGGAGGDYNRGGSKAGRALWKQGSTDVPAMSWCSIPHRVLHELIEDGWLLRADICWDKMRLRPEDAKHVRRPRIQKEAIFMLAKSKSHRYYPGGEVEPGNVWRFPPARGKSHDAPFPDELARRCVLVSTLPGDVVVDPFSGSGTTPRVAQELGRIGIGLDLYAGRKE